MISNGTKKKEERITRKILKMVAVTPKKTSNLCNSNDDRQQSSRHFSCIDYYLCFFWLGLVFFYRFGLFCLKIWWWWWFEIRNKKLAGNLQIIFGCFWKMNYVAFNDGNISSDCSVCVSLCVFVCLFVSVLISFA